MLMDAAHADQIGLYIQAYTRPMTVEVMDAVILTIVSLIAPSPDSSSIERST
jgi:hypothetical protein